MELLESLASNEANALAAQMQRQALEVQQAETKLSELETYLESYHPSQNGAERKSVNAMLLLETQAFLERLREAVNAQRQLAQSSRSRYELLRAQWIAKHLRGTALGKAVDRFQLEEGDEENRRQQHAQDEIAARRRQTW
jgi:flagellar FliJ protein